MKIRSSNIDRALTLVGVVAAIAVMGIPGAAAVAAFAPALVPASGATGLRAVACFDHLSGEVTGDKSKIANRDKTGTEGSPERARAPQPVVFQSVAEPFSEVTERVGFEPTVTQVPHRFSKPAPSAARAPLRDTFWLP